MSNCGCDGNNNNLNILQRNNLLPGNTGNNGVDIFESYMVGTTEDISNVLMDNAFHYRRECSTTGSFRTREFYMIFEFRNVFYPLESLED